MYRPLAVTLILDVELALSKGVPKLDGLISGTADNLSVVGAEADAENIGGVANETAGGKTGVEVPKAESVIP